MALADRITYETLYNPYILIEGIGPGNDFYATINVSTYKPLHKFLIDSRDEKKVSKFVTGKPVYAISVMVSSQENSFDNEEESFENGGLKVGGPVFLEYLLGYATEKILRKRLKGLLKNS